MHRRVTLALTACAAVALLVGACNQSGSTARITHSPTAQAPINNRPGGCAGTVVTDAIPPIWAQGGWVGVTGTSWPVPWAMGSPGDAVAYMWATELVAGPSPRIDGTNNKVLWVTNQPASFVVEGHPFGSSQPTLNVPGGPSIIDAPSPGCWTFQLISKPDSRIVSTVNLQVLPAGSLPPRSG